MLEQTARDFAGRLADSDEPSILQSAAQAVAAAARGANATERERTLAILAGAVRSFDPEKSGLAAILGGALVEEGAAPEPLAAAIASRLPGLLADANRFKEATRAAMQGEDDAQTGAATGDESGLWLGGDSIPRMVVQEQLEADARAVVSYAAMPRWCLPAIACLSRSKKLRAQWRTSYPDTKVQAAELAGAQGEAAFLYEMLQVLDDELLLVLHPSTEQGFLCVMEGVSSNFQLHTLLADALIAEPTAPPRGLLNHVINRPAPTVSDRIAGERPDPRTVAVAKGEDAQQADIPSVGVWNMYQWFALDASGALPADNTAVGEAGGSEREDSLRAWIWGEGVPEDIAVFDGVRVVLLGPALYKRSWNTSRSFGGLRASLAVRETLTAEQVRERLRRLAEGAEERRRKA